MGASLAFSRSKILSLANAPPVWSIRARSASRTNSTGSSAPTCLCIPCCGSMRSKNRASARSRPLMVRTLRSFPGRCTRHRREICRRRSRVRPRTMIELPGSPALSNFRIKKLTERLRALEPSVTGLTCSFVHFIDPTRALSERETQVLQSLLPYGARAPEPHRVPAGELLFVTPRAGTISPWSSKASDIAHVCGLAAVTRIERGVAYRLRAAQNLNRQRLAALAPVLFDRMTEMVFFDANDAVRLFGQAAPRPFARVSLGAGRGALEQANADLGLALSQDEIDYLLAIFTRLQRDPSD